MYCCRYSRYVYLIHNVGEEPFVENEGLDQTAFVQSDQGLHCQFTELMGTLDYINEQRRPYS